MVNKMVRKLSMLKTLASLFRSQINYLLVINVNILDASVATWYIIEQRNRVIESPFQWQNQDNFYLLQK